MQTVSQGEIAVFNLIGLSDSLGLNDPIPPYLKNANINAGSEKNEIPYFNSPEATTLIMLRFLNSNQALKCIRGLGNGKGKAIIAYLWIPLIQILINA